MNHTLSPSKFWTFALTLLLTISGGCGGATPIAGEGNVSGATGGGTMAAHLPDAGDPSSSGGGSGSGGTSGRAGTPQGGSGGVRVGTGGTPGGSGGVGAGTGGTPGGSGGVGGGGAAGRGGTTTACVVGAACGQGFGCDQTCRMRGRAGLIACACGPNSVVSCGMCVAGAAPTCPPAVINGQTCVPGMPGMMVGPGCHTACTNGVEALCTCVPGPRGRGGGGAMSGTWRCVESRAACTP